MEKISSLFKSSSIAGLILGVIAVFYFLVLYIAGIMPAGILKPFLILIIGIIVNVAVVTFMLRDYRKKHGDEINYGYALLYAVFAFLIGSLISSLFSYLFCKFFDPYYMTNLFEAQRKWTESYLEGKVSAEKLEETMNKIDEAAKMPLHLSTLRSFFFNLGIGVAASLILAAVLKKKPEVYQTNI
jgi:hypothetical protein